MIVEIVKYKDKYQIKFGELATLKKIFDTEDEAINYALSNGVGVIRFNGGNAYLANTDINNI